MGETLQGPLPNHGCEAKAGLSVPPTPKRKQTSAPEAQSNVHHRELFGSSRRFLLPEIRAWNEQKMDISNSWIPVARSCIPTIMMSSNGNNSFISAVQRCTRRVLPPVSFESRSNSNFPATFRTRSQPRTRLPSHPRRESNRSKEESFGQH